MSTLAFALAATIKHDGHGGVADLLRTPQQTTTWLTTNHHLITKVLTHPEGHPGDGAAGGHPGDRQLGDGMLGHPRDGHPGDGQLGDGHPRDGHPGDGHPGDGQLGDGQPGDGQLGGGQPGIARLGLLPVLREGQEGMWGEGVQGELLRMRRAVRALFARAVAPGPPSKADADRLMKVEDALRMINRAADRLGTTHLDWADEPTTHWAPRTEDPTKLLLAAVARSTIDFLTSPDRTRLRACPAARCVKYFVQDDPRQTWCSPSCGNRERVNRHYRKRTAG